ncbi:type II secretion system F family protein [Anaeroselena agilis]|uniref:Type II secretion system F family protein n=1 Tax=Anaeroselena agilis TaxID=3063788 RepID=A0ABU3P148_9FIRM|nr:type II secretion system F family protein [Selenomonadales bacterium 4137-cl]
MSKTFAYRAKDRTGQLFTGSVVAENEAAVAAYIRNQGYFVTQIRPAAEKGDSVLRGLADIFNPVGVKDLAVFCRQFATMVDAGLSLTVSLGVMVDQTHNSRLKAAAKDLLVKVQEGETLSRAMQGHPGVFPAVTVSMVEAGEVGGVLDVVLDRLATHFEKESKLTANVKSALTYPAVIMTFAAAAIIFILIFVLPRFVQLFATMNVALPVPTRALVAFSALLQQYGILLAALLAAIAYGMRLYFRQPRGQRLFDQLMLHVPVMGGLWRKIAVARFSRTLSTLLRGGVPIIAALEVVKKTTGNRLMARAITAAQEGVSEGLGLAATLGTARVFPLMVVQMAAVGEETGEVDKMLEKVADFYENDVDDTVSRLSALLGPILIGTLGVVIGAIIIAILMPLFDVISGIGNVKM